MTSKTHWFKNAMFVYAAELICSTGVLGFQIFKLIFWIYIRELKHARFFEMWMATGREHFAWQS